MRYLAERLVLALVGGFFRFLPHRARLAVGGFLGQAFYVTAGRRRRLTLNNLKTAYTGELDGPVVEAIARESFRSMGRNLAEFFAFPGLTGRRLEKLMSWEGEQHLAQAVAAEGGVLLLSAHLGNWDLLGASISHKGYPMSLISKVSRSEALNRIWMGYRQAAGIRIFSGKGTMKEILRHLKSGGVVGFVLDQNALPADGVFVPFFGRPACTLSSLAVLARRTGAPVVPVHTFREGDRHRVIVDPPLQWQELPDRDQDIAGRTAQYTRWTEEVIRHHPGQWTWLHDRWKTRPAGE